jgi:small subunit ribosomal protein S7
MSKELEQVQLWNKWSFKDVEVKDQGLKRYMSLQPIYVPHSMGRHEHGRFHKAEVNIVERLANNLMQPGKNAAKKARALNVLKNAFEIIQLNTGKNPIEILVKAIENAAPCEDTTRLSYGGIVYLMAVDISPQRRIDMALRLICEGARQNAFSNARPLEECLAEELTLAANQEVKSHAISKRYEMERVALANR